MRLKWLEECGEISIIEKRCRKFVKGYFSLMTGAKQRKCKKSEDPL